MNRSAKLLLEEIDDIRHQVQALARSNSLLEAITRKISQWIIVLDIETGEWLFNNHNASDLLKDPECEAQLHQWLKQQVESANRNDNPSITELGLSGNRGTQYFSVEIHSVRWQEGSSLAFVLTDISSDKEQLHTLQKVAFHDTLTRLYNRHYGMELLQEWINENRIFILCFADIDNLKYVNDKFGHAEGDKYIQCVADKLRSALPEAVICRVGGDEFMLLDKSLGMGIAIERMEAVRNGLLAYQADKNVSYEHSISYGIIEINEDNSLMAEELLSIADEKMYEYKRAYKTRRSNSKN